MKKIFSFLLVAGLLLTMALSVSAAGTASMSGPGTVRAGDTITVSFRAGGGIYGGSGAVSYDSSVLTLQSYTPAIGGSYAVEFSGNNFVFYDNSMANPISGATIFTATFQVSSSAQTGSKISVSATGVTLSDGVADSHVGTVSYSATIAPPLSSNANLKSLTVSNASFSPAFHPDTTNYTASVPFSTSSLNVSAVAEDANAKVTVGSTSLMANGYTDVTVTVQAENGNLKTYCIRTWRDQDPNYVKSEVNTLSNLVVEGFRISPAFDPERLHYAVYIPFETESLKVSAERTDGKSQVTLPELAGIPLGESTYEITVTAENDAVRTYTLTVFRADYFDPTAEPTEPPTEAPTEPPTEVPTEPPTEDPTQALTQASTQAPTEPEKPECTTPQTDTLVWILMGTTLLGIVGMIILLILLLKKKRY